MHLASLLLPTWLLWLIAITVMDLRIRKVRNWMVVLGLGMGAVAMAMRMQPFQVSTWNALAGMLAAFAALLPFYALRWMGAGDVKFAAVIGLWFGLSPDLLVIWIGGSLLAGLHGLLVLAWRRLQSSPSAGWLQAHLPLRPASALDAGASAAPTSGPRQIQRSIPYAGYMAITAIWIVLRNTPAPIV